MNKPNTSLTQRVQQAAAAPADRALVGFGQQVTDLFAKRKDQLAIALRGAADPAFLARVIVTAAGKSPLLAKCSVESIYQSALDCAQLGLVPNTPAQEAFLIPRFNSRKQAYEASMQVGRVGWNKMAMRSGSIAGVLAEAVCLGDTFDYDLASGRLTHKRGKRELDARGKYVVIGAWARAQYRDGALSPPVVLWEDDLERIRAFVQRSNGGKLTPMWVDWPDRAAEKSAATRFIRTRLPLDEALHKAFGLDADAKAEAIDVEAFEVLSDSADAGAEEQARAPEVIDVPAPAAQEEEPPPYEPVVERLPPRKVPFDPETGEVLEPEAPPAKAPPKPAPSGAGSVKVRLLRAIKDLRMEERAVEELRGAGFDIGSLADLDEPEMAKALEHFESLKNKQGYKRS